MASDAGPPWSARLTVEAPEVATPGVSPRIVSARPDAVITPA